MFKIPKKRYKSLNWYVINNIVNLALNNGKIIENG